MKHETTIETMHDDDNHHDLEYADVCEHIQIPIMHMPTNKSTYVRCVLCKTMYHVAIKHTMPYDVITITIPTDFG